MFFRNSGGVVHSSSSDDKATLPQQAEVSHLPALHKQNADDDRCEEAVILEKEIAPVSSKANELNTFWTGHAQSPSFQDGLDWFFEPLQGINDPFNPPIHFLEPDFPNQIQYPTLGAPSYQIGTGGPADGVDFNNLMDPHTNPKSDWIFAQSMMLDSLAQVDMRLLQSPFFEVDNLKTFFDLYLKHYHPHFPIIHQPTFSVATCQPLLLIAILNLGSAMVTDETLFQLGQEIHHSLRLVILNSGHFEPPIPLWCLQSLLLVQAYGKMISSRKNYEMAHIFHGTIITMMKRGSLYLTASTSQPSDMSEPPEASWRRWINEESWRRTAFFAFVMDAQHACVFGHSPVLSVIDMRIALPCLESLWECTTAETWQAMHHPEINVSLFLPTLKSLLRENLVPASCSEYARFVLLHGLMSLQTHLQAGSRLTLGIDMGRSSATTRIQDSNQPFCQDNSHSNGECDSSGGIPIWAETIDSALDTWSSSLFSLQPSLCLEAARPLHRVAQITLHASVLDIHTVAVDPPLPSSLPQPGAGPGSSVTNPKTTKALERLRRWAQTESARRACRYALLLVQETMFSGHRYLAREDNVAPRPWCLYIAVLTLWVYGLVTVDPGSDIDCASGAEEYMIRMTRAMHQVIPTKMNVGGPRQITGLIRAVRDALMGCRWELLQEAHLVLRRLGGETVPGVGGDRKTLV